MRICFISGREPAYVRNAVILKGLKRKGIDVLDCTDSSSSYFTRYPKVLYRFMRTRRRDFDLVFVGFLGQPLVPIIRKLTDKPIVFDAFLSTYDTLCFERKRCGPKSPMGRFLYWLDKHSCELSDTTLLDTDAHIGYFADTFGLHRDRFRRILVGADDSMFYPQPSQRRDGKFMVFYCSTYLPVHGVECVIRAAKKLEQHRDIEFEVVGKGAGQKTIRRLAREMGVENVAFMDWVPYEKLPSEIAAADVCLGGHFSSVGKARRVIPGKAYQFIAMRKPVVMGDCPANCEVFSDRYNALFVEMGDEDSLADAILELKDNCSLREQIAENGYKTFVERCTIDAIGEELGKTMETCK